ncbi:uncharacterized protein LOC5522074 isoform X1 [Nematostella vectensis]|uniref:uncharacterized protein LOC5522074 isoform X1 n=1 Tax=Nematostella vectensis TaxID=45351 RepID=UPI00138FEC9B|nr:uncharacterized protein LOC5522074 isoform X1 [Nematostella vectensis]
MADGSLLRSPDGKLQISGSEPISTLSVEGSEPVLGCLVNIPKDANKLREALGIDSNIHHFAFACTTPAFRESSSDIRVVVCRGYTHHGDKRFTIKAHPKHLVSPQSSSQQDIIWQLIPCQDPLKGSRMRKLLKGIEVSNMEEPFEICKGQRELCGIGEKDKRLVFQPFKVMLTDDESFCLGRESFSLLQPAGPLLDKENKNVLGFYWSRENKLVLSFLQRGQVVVEIADEIIVTDSVAVQNSAPSRNGTTVSGGQSVPEAIKTVPAKPKLSLQDIELNLYRNHHDSSVDEQKKVTPGDPLSSLWEKDPSFRDHLATCLDRAYKIRKCVQGWPALATEAKVSKEECEKFSSNETGSASERMFRYIEAAKPRLGLDNLQTAFKKSGQEELHKMLSDYISAGHLRKVKFVSELAAYAPEILGQIMLRIDRDNCWRTVATQLDIPQRVFEQFDNKMKDNPTRQLLHLVHTHDTRLTVEDLKTKLMSIEREDVVEDMQGVPAKIGIDALLSHFTVTEGIERKLNREDAFLQNWRQLAKLYLEAQMISDEDFRGLQPEREARSPATELISHIISSQKPEPTVGDLVVYFARMRRVDCLDILASYLKRGWRDVSDILNKNPALGYRRTISVH